MSRICFGILLLVCAGTCQAQSNTEGQPMSPAVGLEPDVRSRKADPAAVEIPLYAGAPVTDVLEALNQKGFRIKWDPAQVSPAMKLVEKPKSTRIDKMLNEILLPWGLRADHNQMDGSWRVRPVKKK